MRAGVFITAVLVGTAISAALGGGFSLDWHTIDGGGEQLTSGGGFELAGTIGQPDASSFDTPMSGGGYELVGGFWLAASQTLGCACPGDVWPDDVLDGGDIQAFADCLVSGGSNCICADTVPNGVLDLADVDAFVSDLLAGATCP